MIPAKPTGEKINMVAYTIKFEDLAEYQLLALQDAMGGIPAIELINRALGLLKYLVEARQKRRVVVLEDPSDGSRAEVWFKEKA